MKQLLETAIINRDLETVKRLLTTEPMLIDEKSSTGMLLPCLAALKGDLAIIRYIVEYSRASFDKGDEQNRNVLHYAVLSGNLESVRYLVERVGISPTSADLQLITPFDLAHENKLTAIEAYFAEICGATFDGLYRNPIRTGMFPDPSIVRVDDDFYMVNSSFIYFPSIPISHSRDLVHWEIIGYAISNPEWAQLDELEGGRGYWAPDISYHNGKFYIVATYRLNDTGTVYRRQMLVSSSKPEGPYSKPIFFDEDGIDPSLFTDVDGRRYMLLNRGARIFEINEEATEQIGEARLLYYGDNKRAPEGPHLLRKDDYYYLFMAEGGTGIGHRVTVARSRTLFGKYEPCPYNPILRQWKADEPLQRCGHGKPVMTATGEWYMVYLCGRMKNGAYSLLGRETALDPMTWTPDGWPIVNNLQGPSVLQKKPSLPEYCFDENQTDFNGGTELSREWCFPRPPQPHACILDEGMLKLKGSRADLDTMAARNILLVRQKHFNFKVTATLGENRLEIGEDMGLTCYYDENTFLKYGIFRNEQGYILQVKEHIDVDDCISLQIPLTETNELELAIEVEGLRRCFKYRCSNGTWLELGTLDNVYYLCDEGLKKGKRFTGAMVGMYVYSPQREFYGVFKKFNYRKM